MLCTMLLHIPHSSIKIPDDMRSTLLLSDDELHKELLRMTDWFTDLIFDVDGTKRLVFPVSRLVCDPERFSDDALESMASKGMGAIYTQTSEGSLLRKKLSPQERKQLLERFYAPHHAALEAMVQTEINAHGSCLIIDAHSFSSKPLSHEPDQNPNRPDICIGTDAFHTPQELVKVAVGAFEECGLSVAINRPFQGTLVPMKYYQKDKRVLSVMIEVRRGLYMDEESGEKNERFPAVRSQIESALSSILKKEQFEGIR
ncbi:hypothetical protein EXS70_00575 [Candidatus Peribacteria bacterium]|nr:hypothetical protein [Candidatus Peribacteria bacterium]